MTPCEISPSSMLESTSLKAANLSTESRLSVLSIYLHFMYTSCQRELEKNTFRYILHLVAVPLGSESAESRDYYMWMWWWFNKCGRTYHFSGRRGGDRFDWGPDSIAEYTSGRISRLLLLWLKLRVFVDCTHSITQQSVWGTHRKPLQSRARDAWIATERCGRMI